MKIQASVAMGDVVVIDARPSIARDAVRPDLTSGIPLSICPDMGYDCIVLEN